MLHSGSSKSKEHNKNTTVKKKPVCLAIYNLRRLKCHPSYRFMMKSENKHKNESSIEWLMSV